MKFDLKKFLILNFPYALMFWFFNRVGEGYRLAAGADMVAKGMGAISGLGEIISRNPLPSFHPQDLLVGLIGAACIRAAVYIKAKNAKKLVCSIAPGPPRSGLRGQRGGGPDHRTVHHPALDRILRNERKRR